MAQGSSSKKYKTHHPKTPWSTFDCFLVFSSLSFQSIPYLPHSLLCTYIWGSSKNIPKEKLQERTIEETLISISIRVSTLSVESEQKPSRQNPWITLRNGSMCLSHRTQALPKEHKISLIDSNSDLLVSKFIISLTQRRWRVYELWRCLTAEIASLLKSDLHRVKFCLLDICDK